MAVDECRQSQLPWGYYWEEPEARVESASQPSLLATLDNIY